MSTRTLDRRTLLRGVGGAALALPALEAMGFGTRTAQAAAVSPMRFVVSYGGLSLIYGGDSSSLCVPTSEGRSYTTPRGLKALDILGIKGDVTVVSQLLVPWSNKIGDPVPPGGRSPQLHYNNLGPQISGMAGTPTQSSALHATSADQLVAPLLAGTSKLDVLAVRMQGVVQEKTGNLSYKNGLVPPIVSPRILHQTLFTGVSPVPAPPGSTPAPDPKATLLYRQKKTVIDLVKADAKTLMMKLGSADKARVQKHLDEMQVLEQRLNSLGGAGGAGGGSQSVCSSLPPAPSSDPALTTGGEYGQSEETLRADLLTDYMAKAFECDLTRVISYMLTAVKCYMNMSNAININTDMHNITHDGTFPRGAGVADSVSWMIEQWGKLIVKLKKVGPQPDGTTIMDNTAMIMLLEGGYGFDAEVNQNNSPHSSENMIVLLAGKAGGLKPGQHIIAKGKHPANVVLSAMNAVGFKGNMLGQVSGNLPALFS